MLIITEGLGVGLLTGFVGAGGGFLIVPALVLLLKLPIKEAIGTSLIIIAVKSLIGFFYGDATEQIIDWTFLAVFSYLAFRRRLTNCAKGTLGVGNDAPRGSTSGAILNPC